MAYSFVPVVTVPIVGTVTTSIATLVALVVILATLEQVSELDEPYLKNLKIIDPENVGSMETDLRALRLEKSWTEVVKQITKILDELYPKIVATGKDVSKEINKYFGDQLGDLTIYINSKTASSTIVLKESDIKIITESLEPWQKVGGSFVIGSVAGASSGIAASTVAGAALTPAWTLGSFTVPAAIQGLFSGGTIVSATTFTAATVAAPIVLGLTIGVGVFSTTMFTLGKIEEKKLSEFLADIIIAALPMTRIDGEFSTEERDTILQLLGNPKIWEDDKKRVKSVLDSNLSFDDIIAKKLWQDNNKEKDSIKRKLLLAITWEIAKADGKIHKLELDLHEEMANLLLVPAETVKEIRYLITPKLISGELVTI